LSAISTPPLRTSAVQFLQSQKCSVWEIILRPRQAKGGKSYDTEAALEQGQLA
jgi:hypothetical protein